MKVELKRIGVVYGNSASFVYANDDYEITVGVLAYAMKDSNIPTKIELDIDAELVKVPALPTSEPEAEPDLEKFFNDGAKKTVQ